MSTAIIAAVFAIAIGCGMAALLWAARRTARRRTPPIPIFDEAPADLVLKPWSETRGFYFFRAVDLPEDYAELSAGNPFAVFKQFGEDEADALALLNARLSLNLFERNGARVAPAITASSIRFQPLNKRKARTP